MLDRQKYPYTMAFHVFHTLFPVMVERRFLMTIDEISNNSLIETVHTGTEKQWFHEVIYKEIPINRMAYIHSSGGQFILLKPELYAKDVYEIATAHLSNWEEQTRGFIRRDIDDDMRQDLIALDALANDVLEVAKWYGAKRQSFTDDKFMAAFRRTVDTAGRATGRVLTVETASKTFKHEGFTQTFQTRGINHVY